MTNQLGGLGSNFITHDTISGKDINQFRMDFKTFQGKPGNDSYVPLGSVIENRLFTIAQMLYLLTYLILYGGKLFYLLSGNNRKRNELCRTVEAVNSDKLDKNALRWYVQSMMESNPMSMIFDLMVMILYTVASAVKASYIINYLSPLSKSVSYSYPHAANTAVDIGTYAIPFGFVSRGPDKLNGAHVMFNDEDNMHYRETREEFVSSGDNERFVDHYLTCLVFYSIALIIHVTICMHQHRKDVIRVWREGRLFPIMAAEDKNENDREVTEKEGGGGVLRFFTWINNLRRRRKGYNKLGYDYDDDIEEAYTASTVKSAEQMEINESLKYELINSYGENYTRLSPIYSKVFFSYGETAFYGFGFLIFLQVADCACVLIANSTYDNTSVGMTSVVFGETVLTAFLMSTVVFVVLYTVIDSIFFGSHSMSVIYCLLFAINIGTIVCFHPKHVNGVYVFLSATLSLLFTFISFLIHTITTSRHYLQRLDMDRLHHIRKQTMPQRYSNISQLVFKSE